MCTVFFQVRLTGIMEDNSVNKMTSAVLHAWEVEIHMRLAVLIRRERKECSERMLDFGTPQKLLEGFGLPWIMV